MENIKFGKSGKVGKIDFKSKDISRLSKFESISPPSIFIGSKLTYPNVNVGILSPVGEFEDAQVYDDCENWAKNNYSINDVVKLRTGLLNSRFKSKVQDVRLNKKFVEIAKDIALSSKPVDVEIELKNKISSGNLKDNVLTPHGMKGELKDAKITSNVKINNFVDKVIHDEIKSIEGMNLLYKKGINEYSLSKILSIGVLGLSKDKKLVPTRWSITATDDAISKEILKKIKGYNEIENYELMFGEFLGNQYLILLFPSVFSFELFEFYYPGSSWNPGKDFKASHDYEGFLGRKEYAFNCAGGYYATRFPITEYLEKIKRQAGVLVVRLETPSYWASLGVWVVRESVRKAINKGSLKFSDKEEFLDSVKKIAKIKYDFDINLIYEKSWFLNYAEKQKSLGKWF
ncbi:hypothetical protein GW932_01780 [archaeon]|nr:hypothetical protein [archaeon]